MKKKTDACGEKNQFHIAIYLDLCMRFRSRDFRSRGEKIVLPRSAQSKDQLGAIPLDNGALSDSEFCFREDWLLEDTWTWQNMSTYEMTGKVIPSHKLKREYFDTYYIVSQCKITSW